MNVCRCCGPILFVALCAGPHFNAFAQQVDANIEVHTSIGGSADTATAITLNGAPDTLHETDSYNNPTDIARDIDSKLGSLERVETHDEWIGSTANASTLASATAHAQPGDLGVSVSGIASQHSDCCDVQHHPFKYGTADVGARADAFWTDSLLINQPDLPIGKVFFMRSKLTLDGHVTADGAGGTSKVEIGAGIALFDANSHQTFFNTSGSAIFNGSTLQTIPNATTIPIYSPIQNGIRNSLFFQLSLIAEAHAVSSSSEASQNIANFEGEYSGSMHWGGIQDIEDANGNILTGWTITSGSGFDFTQPFSVPEAATSLLVAQALVCCGLRRGRAFNA